MDQGFVPGDVKDIIVGPCNDRPGAIKLGNNQSITQEEAEAIEAIEKAGYRVRFQLCRMFQSVTGQTSKRNLVFKHFLLALSLELELKRVSQTFVPKFLPYRLFLPDSCTLFVS